MGLDRRESLVPQLDLATRHVRDPLRERAGVPGGIPLATAHVERQSHDEPHHVLFVRQASKRRKKRRGVAGIQDPSRMGEEAELVVDGHPHTRLSGVERARPAGAALPSGHRRAISATKAGPPARPLSP